MMKKYWLNGITLVCGISFSVACFAADAIAAKDIYTTKPTVAVSKDKPIWPRLRSTYFGDKPIVTGSKQTLITLDAPERAKDATQVPIALRTKAPAGDAYVKTIYLVIDKNPSPMGAVFSFYPDSGHAEVSTTVRIEAYGNVRAIAELSDGRLFMATRYVKAAGGCSAPADGDLKAMIANLGKAKLALDKPVIDWGKPVRAHLTITHPNVSGLAMNQLTQLYPKPHFLKNVDVRYNDKPVFSATVDFTLSERPNFRFWFRPEKPGKLTIRSADTEDNKFGSAFDVTLGKEVKLSQGTVPAL